ncbi:hypothetical protein [Limnoglobus roseus]|uniref:Phage tail tape measure protein n=1 Tax=Limnoglobus roseus TaxID=2598579 RepID=A0A5C1A453_9BACT|nr:hypothetical protein [Limnoglobus roseus]QEL13871.1 phage tail tape measure protein [Limnoglobus roseus]
MSNSLGTASLVLATDPQPLTQGLGKAKGEITSWTGSVRSRIGDGLKGAFKGIGGAISGGLKSLATGATIGVASSITSKLTESLTSPFERIGDLAKQGTIATSLGLTPEQFTGIAGAAKAAGSDTKDFLEGLITLSSRGREALSGTSEVAANMFSKLKINAADFVKLNPEQQFYKLFEAIQNVKNPAEQVDLLLKAFGEDTGKNLVGLLGKSNEELHKMADQYKVSSEQIAKAQLASEAFTEAQAKIQRVFDEIVIALAPFIEQIGNGISAALGNSGNNFSRFGNIAISVVKAVAKATAALMDVWDKASNAADAFVGEGAVIIGKAIGDDNLVAGGREVRDKGWNDLWNKPFAQNQQKVDEFFAKFEAGMLNNEKLQNRIKKLQNPGKVEQNGQAEMKPIGAALKGSSEAAAIAARFDMDSQRQEDIQKRQLQVQQQANQLLGAIMDSVKNLPILNVL